MGLANLQLALNPPSRQHVLEMEFNGEIHRFDYFPYMGFQRLAGPWQIRTRIIPADAGQAASLTVDSCVTFPSAEAHG